MLYAYCKAKAGFQKEKGNNYGFTKNFRIFRKRIEQQPYAQFYIAFDNFRIIADLYFLHESQMEDNCNELYCCSIDFVGYCNSFYKWKLFSCVNIPYFVSYFSD